MIIDMWYGNKNDEIDDLDWSFTDKYRGNLFIKDKCVGDYVADTLSEVRKYFPQFDKWIVFSHKGEEFLRMPMLGSTADEIRYEKIFQADLHRCPIDEIDVRII